MRKDNLLKYHISNLYTVLAIAEEIINLLEDCMKIMRLFPVFD